MTDQTPQDVPPKSSKTLASHSPLVIVHNHGIDGGPDDPSDAATTSADVEQLRTVLEYLASDHGHEIASRSIGVVEKLQQGLTARGTASAKWERLIQGVIVAVVIASCVTLAALGKFSNEVGIVFVALLGLVFQKKS